MRLKPLILSLGLFLPTPNYGGMYRILSLGNCTEFPVHIETGAGQTYALTREESERALHCLAKISLVEDSWIYDGFQLIDVGMNESRDRADIDTNFIDGELTKNRLSDKFVFYHIHPRATSKQVVSPSSLSDLTYHVLQSTMSGQDGIKLEASVFDGTGKWYYDLKPNEDFSVDCNGNSFETNFSIYAFFRVNYAFDAIDESSSADMTTACGFADALLDLGVYTDYVPLD